MEDTVKVSVWCITYNHKPFIAEALDSFLMQKTNFKYEIIVHDDKSTDGTTHIVESYSAKYPDIIKAIYEDENQYSKGGIREVYRKMLAQTNGKYIAFCEGDDYWTDENKLQKQYDAMEVYSNIDLCVHAYIIEDAFSRRRLEIRSKGKNKKILRTEDAILGEGGFTGTPTMFYRLDAYKRLIELPFCKIIFHDYVKQMGLSFRGGILYLPDCMSTVRDSVPESFSQRMKKNPAAQAEYLERKRKMLRQMDVDTNYVYHNSIQGRLLLYEVSCINSAKQNRAAVRKYKNGFFALPLKKRITTIVKCVAPWLIRVLISIRIGPNNHQK